jgi:YesN/AraC family two-component response regulator
MEEHFYNPDLSLDYLSERFQLNAKYLSQLFKEQFGENFLDFLTMVRVEHAKHMLLNTKSSIQEIGDKVGYTNAVTFRRVFRRMEGISPADFRNLKSKRITSGGVPD